jgi:hypothetical protein
MTIEPKDQQTVRSALLLTRVLLAEFVSTEVKKGELQNRALVRKAQRRLTTATRLLKQLQP